METESRPNKIDLVPAPKRCELCGQEVHWDTWARLRQIVTGKGVEYDALDAVAALAELWERNEKLVGFIFLRCRYPRAFNSELARRLGVTKVWLHRLRIEEGKRNPALALFLKGPIKTRGLEGGRKFQGGSKRGRR